MPRSFRSPAVHLLKVGLESFLFSDAPDSECDQMRFVDGPERFHGSGAKNNPTVVPVSTFQRAQELHFNNFIVGPHVRRLPFCEVVLSEAIYAVLPVLATP